MNFEPSRIKQELAERAEHKRTIRLLHRCQVALAIVLLPALLWIAGQVIGAII